MPKIKALLSALLVMFVITGCASTPQEKKEYSAEGLYMRGYKYMERTSYKQAATYFERLEIEHPYSRWAVKAKIMTAYAHYKAKQYDDAVMALDRFIRFHPGNKDVAYAYYLKARCYYDQIGVIEKDQSVTEKAFEALNQVILRFPYTEYAEDARAKAVLAFNYMAGQEMEVGYYYLTQKNYLSALNRFSTVVNEYQTTTYIEEALFRQIEVYVTLGLGDEADGNLRVLEHNYPKSEWTKKAQQLLKK
ncbi:MAG: outer membrane protein assembly factor BamD [Lactobacillaceae bacterium]|jgi:outer membrane protein assembly factor BamD|nr:outer membrane protein assembly factor BamD [Lactobacillaceae bacterium]